MDSVAIEDQRGHQLLMGGPILPGEGRPARRGVVVALQQASDPGGKRPRAGAQQPPDRPRIIATVSWAPSASSKGVWNAAPAYEQAAIPATGWS
jgi:hypothetical protein